MPNSAPRKPLTILDAMALIAGVAVGLWLFLNKIHFQRLFIEPDDEEWLVTIVALLAGASLAGGPMLLLDRLRARRRWRTGAFLWFGLSAACWGLAPAIAVARLKIVSDEGMAMPCFVYSIPLMGLFGFLSSLIGGRPSPGWLSCRGPWPEWFGMWIAAAWAAAGSYVLFLTYRDVLD